MQVPQKLDKLVMLKFLFSILAKKKFHEACIFNRPMNFETYTYPIAMTSPLPVRRPHQGHYFLKFLPSNLSVQLQFNK